MAELGVGQQTNEYAQQFNDLSALDDNPVAVQRKAAAKANAQALAEKAEKAGAKPPSFKAAVKDTAPEKSQLPENDVFKRNSAYAQKADKYQTDLLPEEEAKFQAWVKQNKVPWQDKPDADYDMRGYWKAQQGGDPSAAQSMNSNDNKMHFPDTYKTPYHKSFSNESRYANPATAPKWNDQDQLVTPDGKVVFDEKAENAPPKPAPGDMKVPLGAGGEADIRKDTNARIAATIREKHPEYEGVPDDKITDGLYNKYYADKMTRDEFNEKVGAKHATEDADTATGVDNALKPITSMPGNVADAASAGMKTFGEGLPDPKSKSFFPSSNPLKMIAGAAQVAGAPATGAAKSLVGDPLRENLPDTSAGRAVAGTAETVAAVPLGGVEALGARSFGRGVKEAGGLVKDVAGAVTGKPAKAALEATRGKVAGTVAQGAEENAARFKTLTDEYTAAGKDAETASKAAQEHSALLDQAEQGAKTLDEKLLTNPKLPAKDFGDTLHKTVSDMEDKYITQRAEESGYTKALEAAKDKAVDTTPVTQVMDDWAKITNTKGTDEVIKEVKNRMTSIGAGAEGDVANSTQTVAKLNSFRKQIGDALRTKVFSDKAVDSETYKVLKAAKDAIDGVIDGATKDLTAARKKWAELSSPLDIMSQKGPLAKVLAVNPAGRDAAMAGAQVAGTIIKRANEGHEVFTRILAENPSLRDDARMFFAQDLFGGGKVPSPTALKAWLEKNRQSLIQTKLFDEFSDIYRAKKSADEAVAQAGGNVKRSMAEEKAALQREKAAGGKKDAAETAQRDYERFEVDLRRKPDKSTVAETRKLLTKLYDDKRLDLESYDALTKEVNAVEGMRLGSEEMRSKLLKLGHYGLLGAGMSYAGLNAIKALLQ